MAEEMISIFHTSTIPEVTKRYSYDGIRTTFNRVRNNSEIKKFITVPEGGIPLCRDYQDLEIEMLRKLKGACQR